MKDSKKTEIILNKLEEFYSTWGRERSNIIFPELRLGSGYSGISQRRIDLFLINSSEGNATTAFEIKVSRKDFKNDTDKEIKQRGARLFSNYFYYVTPKGMLKIDEIPIWAGLLEYDLEQDGDYPRFAEIIPAPLRDKSSPSWGLITSLIRKINKQIYATQNRELEQENRRLKLEQEKLKIEIKNLNCRLLPDMADIINSGM